MSIFMCIDIYKLYIYIDFSKTGNVEQELPRQNIFLYVSGFSGETGGPRFFHIFLGENILHFFDLQSTVPNGDEVRDTMLKQSEDCRAW